MSVATRGEWKISWCTRASSSSSSSSLFRTAAAVVWLLSIFQNRRGKRDKPEDVASTCPVSVKTHLQASFPRGGEEERGGEKKRRKITTPYKRSSVEHGRFLIPLPPFREKRKCKVGEGNFLRGGKNFQIFSSNFVPPSSFLPLIASNAYI